MTAFYNNLAFLKKRKGAETRRLFSGEEGNVMCDFLTFPLKFTYQLTNLAKRSQVGGT